MLKALENDIARTWQTVGQKGLENRRKNRHIIDKDICYLLSILWSQFYGLNLIDKYVLAHSHPIYAV
jgi:hypothetical protein